MINLDVNRMREKEEAHAYVKAMLGFPAYYGNNLDALYDCLTSLDKAELAFENFGENNGYFDRMLRVFEDASACNPGLSITFAGKDTGNVISESAAEETDEEAGSIVPDEEDAFRWE